MKSVLLAATLLAGGMGGASYAQPAGTTAAAPDATGTYDPAQLPAIRGTVAQYSLTPRGDVDGLILQDGTQVHVSPRLSAALVFAIRPGDAVTIHGLKARAVPLVMAMSISNDATHQTVVELQRHGPRMPGEPASEISGQVKAPLYGPHGEVNGVLLTDGTELRLPPPEAERLGDALAAGKPLAARGEAISSPLGRVFLAHAIGPDTAHLTRIAMPHPGEHGRHGHDHGAKWGDHGPGAGPGPNAGSNAGPDEDAAPAPQ